MIKSFVISDLHFGHKNIISYCGRPFRTVEGMNLALIQRWNSVVSKADTVYCVGDFSFHGKSSDVKAILDQLNGNKYLIKGNHDNLSDAKYVEAGFSAVYREFFLAYDGTIIFMQHIPNLERARDDYDVYIHGHTHDRDPDWDTPNRFNCCVEKINYTPIDLDDVISYIELKKESNE